jgi:hypothetical protein
MTVGNAGFFAIVLGFLWFIATSVTLVRQVGTKRRMAWSKRFVDRSATPGVG